MPLVFDATYFQGTGQIGYSDYEHTHGYLRHEVEVILAAFGPTFGRVLDVGCAYGYLTELLRAEGIDAQGIDISAYAVGRDVSGGHISELSILRNPNTGFLDGEFDLVCAVYLGECLERIVDFRKALREMVRIGSRFYAVTSLASPNPHLNLTVEEHDAFVLGEFPAPDWTVTFDSTEPIAFGPARRSIIVPGA